MKKHLLLLVITTGFFLCSCTAGQHKIEEPASQAEYSGHKTFHRIRINLEKCGEIIDYDTLMHTYNSLVQSQHQIPHIDKLLILLMNKRNSNPRIDQMILILSSKIIGSSKFHIPYVYDVFESILKMDNNRLNEWVFSFVAASIGRYPFEIPNGDRLVDFLEIRREQTVSFSMKHPKEFYGFHFMPPPQNPYIRSYIGNIKERRTRELERMNYYSLKRYNISDDKIEIALKRIQKEGVPKTGDKSSFPLEYLILNMNSILSEMEKHQTQLPVNYENKRYWEQK